MPAAPDSCGRGTRGAGAPQMPQHVRMGPLRCSPVLGRGPWRAGTGGRAARALGPVLTSLCHSRRRASREGEKHGPPLALCAADHGPQSRWGRRRSGQLQTGPGGRPAADSRSTRSGRGVWQWEGNRVGGSSSRRSATHPEALCLGSFSGGRPGRLGLASVWEPKPPAVARLVCKWVVTGP